MTMQFIAPPPDAPGKPVVVGPPQGVEDRDCATAMATYERLHGGRFDGWPVFHVWAQFDEHELAALAAGGSVCISFYQDVMPMHSVEIVGKQA